ncbi:ran-binding protein 10 [Paenibacillus peoriae]|uniref:ran-binding protein 10 n=1 Tax=Paenibacillus peoriae TaxID=59893 RepID=UPI00026C5AE6|nr:ran-binding protein 10 [Paenibacillus peoriae]MEC0183577.1 ran-binding protein 10 [Paenibacillus peoriae]
MKKLLPILLSLFLLPWFAQITHAATPEAEATNLIPKMTSDTSPSGKVTYSDAMGGLEGFRAFDGIPSYSLNGSYTSWGTSSVSGWLSYEFDNAKIVNKYVLYFGGYQTNNHTIGAELPSTWTFEGSNDGKEWTVLDSKTNFNYLKDYKPGKNEFDISNPQPFKIYKINVTKNNGGSGGQVNLSIHEMEIWGYDPSTQTPDPVEPTEPSEPSQPTGDRAILVITLDTGLEKEFDLSKKELNAFIAWYDAKDAGRGTASYAIDKHGNNKGPFSNRKDYVIFNKILMFEVSEYSIK